MGGWRRRKSGEGLKGRISASSTPSTVASTTRAPAPGTRRWVGERRAVRRGKCRRAVESAWISWSLDGTWAEKANRMAMLMLDAKRSKMVSGISLESPSPAPAGCVKTVVLCTWTSMPSSASTCSAVLYVLYSKCTAAATVVCDCHVRSCMQPDGPDL